MTEKQRRRARKACTELREATDRAGCPLPSLGVDAASVITGGVLVQLGGALPDVITRLAEVIRAGTAALAAGEPEGTVSRLWPPAVGELVVDTGADRVGEFRSEDDAGRWLLAPPAGGDPWAANPDAVRMAGPGDQVRAEAARATARSQKRVG
ncbi:hypothetical protein [Kitasatospora kazusensis]